MWDFPPLFSPHKSTNSLCLSLPLPVPLPPIHVHVTVYGKPAERFAPWKNIPLMNLLKHWSDLAQFVHSRFVTRWNVLRSSESSGLGSRLPCEIHYKARSHRRRKGRRRSYLLIRCFKHFRGLVPCLRAPQECSEIAPAPILQPSQYPIVLSKTETQTSLPGQTHTGWAAAETSTIHSTFSLNSVLIGLNGLVWDEWWEQLDLCKLNRLHKSVIRSVIVLITDTNIFF